MLALKHTVPQRPEFSLGVLFVHGIGVQPSRETLVRWGDALVKTIELSTNGVIAPTVDSAGPDDSSSEGGLEAVIRFPEDPAGERWLLSEGWWAEAYPAPTYAELAAWSLKALPWAVAIHVAQRFWQTSSLRFTPRGQIDWKYVMADRQRLFALVDALVRFSLGMLLLPVFIVMLAIALVLGPLPIPKLRELIIAAQSAISLTVGDTLAFVESPLRAALIRTRVRNRLERLQQRCERTVVLAHSQGAAVCLDVMGGITSPRIARTTAKREWQQQPQRQQQDGPSESASDRIPNTLVTFGAGVNQLVSLRVLSSRVPHELSKGPQRKQAEDDQTDKAEDAGANPAIMGAVGVVVFLGCIVWQGWLWWSGRHTLARISACFGLYLLWLTTFLLLVSAANWLEGKVDRQRKLSYVVKGISPAVTMIVFLMPMLWLWVFGAPFGATMGIFAGCALLLGSTIVLLSPATKEAVTRVQRPVGLERWIDLYASNDPVPNGPTRTTGPAIDESVQIWNRGSLFADHTSYWENLDGFVLRVLRACASTAGSSWEKLLPPETRAENARAEWRVDFLRWARLFTSLTWLVVGAFVAVAYRYDLPLLVDLPPWVPAMGVRWLFVAAGITYAIWATSGILCAVWRWWAHSEQKVALAQREHEEAWWFWLMPIGLIAWLLFFAAGTWMITINNPPGRRAKDVGDLLTVVFGSAVGSTLFLGLFHGPPHRSMVRHHTPRPQRKRNITTQRHRSHCLSKASHVASKVDSKLIVHS